MEQLVILVLIGLISLINWIVQKSAEARERRKAEKPESAGDSLRFREEPEPEPIPARTPPDESRADEPLRGLMEALGVEYPKVETPSSPPPPLPSLVEAAKRFERAAPQVEAPPQPPRGSAPRSRRAKPRPKKTRVRPTRVHDLLSAPHGLRHGILLSEILGPPKSLRKE